MVLFVLESMEKLSGISQNLRRVLKSLVDLFVLYSIAENSGGFLEVQCNMDQLISQFFCVTLPFGTGLLQHTCMFSSTRLEF